MPLNKTAAKTFTDPVQDEHRCRGNRFNPWQILNNDRGVALLITLGVVAVLVAGALQLGKFTGDSVMEGLVLKDRFKAEQMARSGIELARMILAQDAEKTDVDSIQEDWADPEKLNMAAALMMGKEGVLEIKITDELSKIQVNALISEYPGNQINSDQQRILENFFNLRFSSDKSGDERDASEIINCMKDWLDANDDDTVSGLTGAESDYYQKLDPSYECANGPFNRIEELFSVKGVTSDVLANANEDDEEADEEADTNAPEQLGDYFTVYGLNNDKGEQGGFQYTGKVNINTAGLAVLEALLPEGMEDMAADIVDFRQERTEDDDAYVNALDKGWYKSVISLSETEQKAVDNLITYSSDLFRVDTIARENNSQVGLTAILKREKAQESKKWMCRIIQLERI